MSPLPLQIRSLNVAYHRKLVLWDADVGINPGKITAIAGPNGAGKSTLLKAALGLIPTTSGEVLFFGDTLKRNRNRVAYVPQRESVDWDFPVTARDVVTMGLYRRIGWCLPVRSSHRRLAEEALADVGLADFSRRQINQLSGGQQQRAGSIVPSGPGVTYAYVPRPRDASIMVSPRQGSGSEMERWRR